MYLFQCFGDKSINEIQEDFGKSYASVSSFNQYYLNQIQNFIFYFFFDWIKF